MEGMCWCGLVSGQLMNTSGGKATVRGSDCRKTLLEKSLKAEINDGIQLRVLPQMK